MGQANETIKGRYFQFKPHQVMRIPPRSQSHSCECYTWKNYLDKLVKKGKVIRYLDKSVAQPRKNTDVNEEPPNNTIQINGIFAESEHLGATNNSKKRKM
ncbi:hypothetical protein ACFX1W_035092 [Malus domestica]